MIQILCKTLYVLKFFKIQVTLTEMLSFFFLNQTIVQLMIIKFHAFSSVCIFFCHVMILPNTIRRERRPEAWMNKRLQNCLFTSDPECTVRLIHITDNFYDINANTDKGYRPLYPEVSNEHLESLAVSFHTFSVCVC
jgi:hypothetical protein